MQSIRDQLEKADFFATLCPYSKDSLATICELHKFKKKNFLFHENDQGKAIFLLVEGIIQLCKYTAAGKETVIKIVQPGEIFGEVILFEQDTYPVTAIALSDALLLEIPKKGIHQLLDKADFRNDFIAALMNKQRYLTRQISYLSSYDLEERLRLFLLEHYGQKSEIDCSLSKKDMAAALGATPESLSRLFARLKQAGNLIWDKNIIRIKSRFWEDVEELGV